MSLVFRVSSLQMIWKWELEHQQQVYQGVLEAVQTNKLTTAAIDAAAVRIVENKMIKLLDAGKQQELWNDVQKEAQ